MSYALSTDGGLSTSTTSTSQNYFGPKLFTRHYFNSDAENIQVKSLNHSLITYCKKYQGRLKLKHEERLDAGNCKVPPL